MNGYDTRFYTYTTEVANWKHIKVISQTVLKNDKMYLVGPINGDFQTSQLYVADFTSSSNHKSVPFEVQLVDDFENQYINTM